VGGPPDWGLGGGLTTLPHKIQYLLRNTTQSLGEERKLYRVLVGKPKGKRELGRPRRRWEDGIRMDLKDIGLGCVDWIRPAQDRDRWRAVVSAVMKLRVLAPQLLLGCTNFFLNNLKTMIRCKI
jgi:hypothetical protein